MRYAPRVRIHAMCPRRRTLAPEVTPGENGVDGRMDGMDGRDGWKDGRTDGCMDGWMVTISQVHAGARSMDRIWAGYGSMSTRLFRNIDW
jgi:hypothetical protein